MTVTSEATVFRQAQEPADFRHTFKTRWMPADDAETVNGQPLVEACLVEEEGLDPYGLVLSSRPVILHRFYDTKQRRMGRDVSATAVRADAMLDEKKGDDIIRAGLMTRFRSVIGEYLQLLRRERRPIPIDFLGDRIPAAVIRQARTAGLNTAEDFARASDATLNGIQESLRRSGEEFYANHIRTFRNRAAEWAGISVTEVPVEQGVKAQVEPQPVGGTITRPRRGRPRRTARR